MSEDAAIDLASDSSDEEGEGARGVSRWPIDIDNFVMDAWEVLVGRTLKPDPDAGGRPEAAQAPVVVKQEPEAGANEPPAAESAGVAASELEEEEGEEEQEAARGGGRAGATPKAIRAASIAKDGTGWLPIHRSLNEGEGVGLVRELLEAGRGGAIAGRGQRLQVADPPCRGVQHERGGGRAAAGAGRGAAAAGL